MEEMPVATIQYPEPSGKPPIFGTFDSSSQFDTSLAGAVAHQNATSNAQVLWYNQKLTQDFLAKWANYVLNMTSGHVLPLEQQIPPRPPNAYVLTSPDVNGFQYPTVGDQPVMATPPLPVYAAANLKPNAPPSVPLIGDAIPGSSGWYQALPGDNFPNGKITDVQPDGHTYQKYSAPVGTGWYLRVS